MYPQAKGDKMPTHGPQHRKTSGTTYYCDECARAHVNAGAPVGDTPDAILGLRGEASSIQYAWCARERAYHITSRKRADASIGIVTGKLADLWTRNTHTGAGAVRIAAPATDSANVARIRVTEFAAAYNAQRVNNARAPMTRGGGNGARIYAPHVTLTAATRRALRASNDWSNAERNAERAADWRALCAKIDARERA